jgi:hypothetical protein
MTARDEPLIRNRGHRLGKPSVGLAITVVLLIIAAAEVRRYKRHALAPFADLSRVYLELALAGDSAGMRARATDDRAVASTLSLARGDPERVRAAVRTMRLINGRRDSAHASVFFRTNVDWCAGVVGAADLQATFDRVAGTWKIHYAGVGPC